MPERDGQDLRFLHMVNDIAADTHYTAKVIHAEVLIIQVGKNNFCEFVYKCLILGKWLGHGRNFN